MIEWFEGLSFMAQLGVVIVVDIAVAAIITFFGEIVSADEIV